MLQFPQQGIICLDLSGDFTTVEDDAFFALAHGYQTRYLLVTSAHFSCQIKCSSLFQHSETGFSPILCAFKALGYPFIFLRFGSRGSPINFFLVNFVLVLLFPSISLRHSYY